MRVEDEFKDTQSNLPLGYPFERILTTPLRTRVMLGKTKTLVLDSWACWVKMSVLDDTFGSPRSINQLLMLNFTLENPLTARQDDQDPIDLDNYVR